MPTNIDHAISNPFNMFVYLMRQGLTIEKAADAKRHHKFGWLFQAPGMARALDIYLNLHETHGYESLFDQLAKAWAESDEFRAQPFKVDLPKVFYDLGIPWDNRIARPDLNWRAESKLKAWSIDLFNSPRIDLEPQPKAQPKAQGDQQGSRHVDQIEDPYEVFAELYDLTADTAKFVLDLAVSDLPMSIAVKRIDDRLGKLKATFARRAWKEAREDRRAWQEAIRMWEDQQAPAAQAPAAQAPAAQAPAAQAQDLEAIIATVTQAVMAALASKQ